MDNSSKVIYIFQIRTLILLGFSLFLGGFFFDMTIENILDGTTFYGPGIAIIGIATMWYYLIKKFISHLPNLRRLADEQLKKWLRNIEQENQKASDSNVHTLVRYIEDDWLGYQVQT